MTLTRDRVTTTLGQLTPDDQGREVVITNEHGSIAGTLTSLIVDQEWIDITDLATPYDKQPKQIPGMVTVRVSIGVWHAENLPLATRVDVYR